MKQRFTIAISAVFLGVLVLASPAIAQRGMGGRAGLGGRGTARGGFGMGGLGGFHPAPTSPYLGGRARRGRGRGWGIGPGWGWGGFVPYLDYDYWNYPPDMGYYDPSGYEPAPEPPPPVMVQARQPDKVIQPMVLEKQGDRWVRITVDSQSLASGQPSATEVPAGPKAAAEPPRPVPPAVLVFRDGHQEEVERYTIIDGTLYARANYWTGSSWTKKIQISSLDVPATLKLNQERGSNFKLPSGPHEVMIRP